MSKRGPIIVVGIVIVVLLAAPFAIGMVNENAMRRDLDALPATSGIDATIAEFDRGWFNSTVRLDLKLSQDYLATLGDLTDPMVAQAAQFELPIIVEIGHGPVLLDGGVGLGTAAVRAYLDPESELATFAETVLEMPYLIELRGRGGFGSGFRFEGEVPSADFAMPEMSVSWTPFTFAGVFGTGEANVDASLANFTLQTPFASAIVDTMTLASDWRQASTDALTLGNFEMSFGRIVANDPLLGATPIFSLDDASFLASVDESEVAGLVNSQAVYRVGSLTVSDEFAISDAAVGATVFNLDAVALAELTQLGNSVPAGIDIAQLQAEISALTDRILATNPSLEITPFEFSMPEGDFVGTLHATLDSSALPGDSMLVFENPEILMTAISADIELSASRPLAQRIATLMMADQLPAFGPDGQPLTPEQQELMAVGQASLMLGMLAGQGFVVEDGDVLRSEITFENGLLLANGQPLTF